MGCGVYSETMRDEIGKAHHFAPLKKPLRAKKPSSPKVNCAAQEEVVWGRQNRYTFTRRILLS